ncbi:DUF6252 family protein [Flavobacterium okayamense]|uniref:Lipoprotein n=1 Tax=Flavobacterium okayamense TaxID=2830782 RepID=A0ABN6HXY5_9FLAO|nr:DUF6252 family protein [Flavobacterium okayamense]BCY29244.1 hypothetical protein KK2020170_21120 [Flavobacterium okayamense]
MKKINLVLSVFAILFFAACSDVEPLDPSLLSNSGNNSGGNNGGGSGSGGNGGGSGGSSGSSVFKADFDGQTWNANTTQAIVNSSYIALTGIHLNGSFFQITIPNGTVGTYTWANSSPNNPMAVTYSPGSGQTSFLSLSNSQASGTGYVGYTDTAEIVISSINTTNNTISGTFKFTGVRFDSTLTNTETKVFTNGVFNLSYTANNTSPGNNSFFCKVDGADYNPTNVDGYITGSQISLIGRRGAVETISLTLNQTISPGTYPLDDLPLGNNNIGMYNLDNTGNIFGADPGTVTITTHNTSSKRIVGTFEFTATSFLTSGSYQITNGSFDIIYQ